MIKEFNRHRIEETTHQGLDNKGISDALKNIIVDRESGFNRSFTEEKMINGISINDIETAIRELDFEKAPINYVISLTKDGYPDEISNKSENSLGTVRTVVTDIKVDRSADIKIRAKVDLLNLKNNGFKFKVSLYPARIESNVDIERTGVDGRCAKCEGYGCIDCGQTGGY
jgi:hypothetical protein